MTLRKRAASTRRGFTVGSTVLCLASFDDTWHPAEIIEKREGKEAEYYVHFKDFDRRLDDWVPMSRLQSLPPADPPAGARASGRNSGRSNGVAGNVTKNGKAVKRPREDYGQVPRMVEDLALPHRSAEPEHEEKAKPKNIHAIQLGKYEIETWYYSPFPDEYAHVPKLFVCEYCLKFRKSQKAFGRHLAKCTLRHPPGDEIYRAFVDTPDDAKGGVPADANKGVSGPCEASLMPRTQLSMFEVDGRKNKSYCQNLCLVAKLFLDHKTLYYDVDAFLFYILTGCDARGYHVLGYFSKEKASRDEYNLACILTLPPHQRKGYGRFLIAFAYELSKKEGKVGTPERPLSDLGALGFARYWADELMAFLLAHAEGGAPGSSEHPAAGSSSSASACVPRGLSIREMSEATGIRPDDVAATLQALNVIKYWKGQHLLVVAPPSAGTQGSAGSSAAAAKLAIGPPAVAHAAAPAVAPLMSSAPSVVVAPTSATVRHALVDARKLHWAPLSQGVGAGAPKKPRG